MTVDRRPSNSGDESGTILVADDSCQAPDSESFQQSGTLTHTDRTPLPKLQLFVIFLIQISEPITGTVIYPFVNQFVRDTGVTKGDERKTGYYAGTIESTFFLSEALTVFQWGWLSDKLGRKPVLLMGPLGLAFSMLGFGLSKTFASLVLFRCLQGIFNGNIGVSKSVMAEITDETNIGEVFSMMPLMWSLGITMGPIIGGIFTGPAQRWPRVFEHIHIVQNHPYLLPCAIAAFLSFTSFSVGTIALKETLPSAPGRRKLICIAQKVSIGRRRQQVDRRATLLENTRVADYGSTYTESRRSSCDEEIASIDTATTDLNLPAATTSQFRALLVRPLLLTYLNYFFIAFMDMAHSALLPLMYSTSISLGGLGLDPYRIGVLMGTFGTINATLQLKYLGRLIRRYGPRTIYIGSYMSFLVCIGLFPVASYVTRQAGEVNWMTAIVVAIQLTAQVPILACYACIQILVVSNAPSKASLGATNGIGQMIASSMRSLAPTVASSLFSVSLERKLAGGYLVYYVLLLIVLVGMWVSWYLPRTVQ